MDLNAVMLDEILFGAVVPFKGFPVATGQSCLTNQISFIQFAYFHSNFMAMNRSISLLLQFLRREFSSM